MAILTAPEVVSSKKIDTIDTTAATIIGIIALVIKKLLVPFIFNEITSVNNILIAKAIAMMIKEITKSQKIMGFLTTPIIIVLMVFNKDFYELWVPYSDISLIVSLSTIDLIRMLIIGVVWPIVNLNIVMDKIKKPAIFIIISGFINILSMIFLIKKCEIGIYAIVITTLVISIVYYGFYIPMYASKISKIKAIHFYKIIFEMIICSLLLLIIIYPIHQLLSINNWFDFVLYGSLTGIICIVVSALIYQVVGINTIIKLRGYLNEKK